ncbi:hypothetical protein EVB99_022 [Rhizobium phage RHph_N3_19]|nr:hypothetical protein EVB99_022 [Rhizobium phage RHph_N3_19]
MNSLSWLLYFAGVSENIGTAFTMLSFLFGFGALVATFFVVGTRLDEPNRPEYHAPMWILFSSAIPFFLFLAIAVLVPSKDTVYLIAGYEIGETVVKTPEAQQMFSDIREIIQQQLKSLKKE